jgi:hypothetical protein
MTSLYAVEMKVIGTFSTYVQAESKEEAQQTVRDRARQMNPDSVVFESVAYQMQPCERCGEQHLDPCSNLIRPSWERARL